MSRFIYVLSMMLAPLLAQASFAQSAMTASEFEAYVNGRTLFYENDGARYGVEEYLPDRRVRWSFLDGRCKDGYWYARADQICFLYEDNPVPQCWRFYERAHGLTAQFKNEPEGSELYEMEAAGEEMLCLGPEVGV